MNNYTIHGFNGMSLLLWYTDKNNKTLQTFCGFSLSQIKCRELEGGVLNMIINGKF